MKLEGDSDSTGYSSDEDRDRVCSLTAPIIVVSNRWDEKAELQFNISSLSFTFPVGNAHTPTAKKTPWVPVFLYKYVLRIWYISLVLSLKC